MAFAGKASDDRVVRAVLDHGGEAVSFQTLESGLDRISDDGAEGTGAVVCYADTGGGWVAAGAPLVDPARREAAAQRFIARARGEGRRASFFAIENPDQLGAIDRVVIGAQPHFDPTGWAARLGSARRLREQLRRARAKGVTVMPIAMAELTDGRPLRVEADRLARQWLASRHMAAMGFLVTLELFVHPEQHRYYGAFRDGRLIALLSLVPIPAEQGWLFEDLVRASAAPNGTSELLIDCAMRDLAQSGCRRATLGLAPIGADAPWWMRLGGWLGRPLYDFRGVRAFKQRLHPDSWQKVYLAHGPGPRILHIVDSLRAFAGGSLIRFGARTIVQSPSALPWALALPLVPWAILLAVLASTGHGGVVGFDQLTLTAWAVFDAILAGLLFHVARRPRRRHLAMLATVAAIDAALSVAHLLDVGLGPTVASAVLRTLATGAPIIGTLALAYASFRAR